MKILCKSATQVLGRGVVEKGQTIDWRDGVPFPPQVLGNFVEAESGLRLANVELPKDAEGDKPDAEGDKPDAEGDKPDAEGEKPDAEGATTRQPTLEEAAAEQARAEKLAKDELVKRTAALGREKLTAALDACGATYKAKDSCEELAKKLLRAQGQEID